MNENNFTSIINSRAFSYFVGTICILVLANKAVDIFKDFRDKDLQKRK